MARDIATRIRVTGQLEVVTPLHVGGADTAADTHLPLAVNGAGTAYVPGSSLAGALRAWCETRFAAHAELVEYVWGSGPDPDGSGGHASLLRVEDAVVDTQPLPTEVRDVVGIDRRRGAAAKRIKHDRAVLPRGTRVALELSLELRSDDHAPRAEAMLGHLLAALEAGQVELGAARSRGLGRVRLVEPRIDRFAGLDTREGMLDLLEALGAAGRAARETILADLIAVAAIAPAEPPAVDISVHWRPVGPLMVKAGYEGIGVDLVPLLSGDGEQLAPVLPGSSVKGVLRSHAERIVRTVANLGCADDPAEQLEVPLVEALFGAPGKGDRDAKDDGERGPPLPGIGAVRVEDTYAESRIAPRDWDAVAFAPRENVTAALRDAGMAHWKPTWHVAIDRWTASPVEGFLFSTLEPHDVAWRPVRMRLDLARLDEAEREPAVALLLLVLRDLGRGQLPLGFDVNDGLGAIEVDTVQFSGRSLPDSLACLADASLPGAAPRGLDGALRETLQHAWKNWIGRQREVTA